MPVITVALDRNSAGLANGMFERGDALLLRPSRSAHAMPCPMNIEPFFGCFFAAADFVPHIRVENFGAPTGDRAETVFAQKLEHFRNRDLEDSLREMANLNCSKRLNVEIGIESTQT